MKLVEQNEAGCWIWKGDYNGTYGYGCYVIDKRKVTAHRVMYMSIHGPLEKKQLVCHKCDVAACVNPLHMFVGSQKENMQDCRRKNRHFKGAMTLCVRGHPLSGDNLYVSKHNRRSCIICDRARGRIRAGWPEDLAYSLPPQPLGYKPVGIGNPNYRREKRRAHPTPAEGK